MTKNKTLRELRQEVALQLCEIRLQRGYTQEEAFAQIHCHLLPRKARRVDLGQYDYSLNMLVLFANVYNKRVKVIFE